MYSKTMYKRFDLYLHANVKLIIDLLFEALDQSHNVFLFQISQHFNFSQCGLLYNIIVVRLLKFLYSHYKTLVNIKTISNLTLSQIGAIKTHNLPISPVSLCRAW
jgi:hypothetical protein